MYDGEVINRDDVVQISPDADVNASLCGMFAVVDKCEAWGVKAHVPLTEGDAHVRLVTGEFARVGKAVWTVPG